MGLDSMEKIIFKYIIPVSRDVIEFKGKIYTPKPLFISNQVFSSLICPPNCGQCCPEHTLDYLPFEETPRQIEEAQILCSIDLNGERFYYNSFIQKELERCTFLDKNKRCREHNLKPLSCLFPPLKFLDKGAYYLLTADYFIDLPKAQCILTPDWTRESIEEVIDKLCRLEGWCDYFEIASKVDSILTLIEGGYNGIRSTEKNNN